MISDELFECCLRALYHAPADKPTLKLLLDMADVDPEGFRAALELAFAAGRESVAGATARVAEESLITVFRLIERADREGLDVISVQGLRHLVGTRDEFYRNAEDGRRIEAVLARWYNLDSAVGL